MLSVLFFTYICVYVFTLHFLASSRHFGPSAVCLAVWLCMSCRTTGEKIAAIAMPVTAFVACGFEHSIANMYFVPFAILTRSLADPSLFGELPGVALEQLTWARVGATLMPVTLGNVIGGGVLVGAVYWLVYCRGRARTS